MRDARVPARCAQAMRSRECLTTEMQARLLATTSTHFHLVPREPLGHAQAFNVASFTAKRAARCWARRALDMA